MSETVPIWLQHTRIRLTRRFPFFGYLVYILEPQERELPMGSPAATDGKYLYYNDKLMQALPDEHQLSVLAHEVLHNADQHIVRMGNRNQLLWNIAADYKVNQELKRAGFKLPKGALLDPRFDEMSTEQVYHILEKEFPIPQLVQCKINVSGLDKSPTNADGQGGQQGKQGKDSNGQFGTGWAQGDIQMPAGGKDSTEAKAKQAEWQWKTVAAAQRCKEAGTLPAGFERYVIPSKAKVPWEAELAEFMLARSNSDYTWRTPNSNYRHLGLYLPSLTVPNMGSIVIAVDTSGSVDDIMLARFSAEISAIVSRIKPEITYVGYVDAKLHKVVEFTPQDVVELTHHGGGGTDFRPMFKWVEKEGIEPACFIYLTDLWCSDYPKKEPGYPVLWVSVEPTAPDPKFGKRINMEL